MTAGVRYAAASQQRARSDATGGASLAGDPCGTVFQQLLVKPAVSEEQTTLAFSKAAEWIAGADAMLIGSGAGMSVESGLSTFRGSQKGTWAGLDAVDLAYEEICHPRWFDEDPHLGWAFWNFCHQAYQGTVPHEGHVAVREWAQRCPLGFFSFTSNIDSHWAASGMKADSVLEVHGAVRWLQCSKPCCPDVWRAARDLGLTEDQATHRVRGALPACPKCKAVARPNVLMFGGDAGFSRARRGTQHARYDAWLKGLEARPDKESLRLVCVEFGCGLTVPTVRKELESVMRRFPAARLVRVNLESPGLAPELAERGVSLPLPAYPAIQELGRRMASMEDLEPEATFVLWGMWESGGAEVRAPRGASLGRLLRLAAAEEGVSVEFDCDLRGWPQATLGADAPEVRLPDPIPASCFQDIMSGAGDERRVTAVVVVEAQIWNDQEDADNMNEALQLRCERAGRLLQDLNARFQEASYQCEVRGCRDRRGVQKLARAVQFEVLPRYGIEASEKGTQAMMAFIGSCLGGSNWSSWGIQEEVDKSMDLSHVKRVDHLPLVERSV